MRDFEDATRAADQERAAVMAWPGFWRASTPTELTLLAAVGYPVTPAGVDCQIVYVTPGIRRREWPAQDGAGQ